MLTLECSFVFKVSCPVVLATVITFILPSAGLMLLLLALFGLLVVGLLIMFFAPKNITNLIIAWLAAGPPEGVPTSSRPRGLA